jgi:hypothetical protein
LNDARAPGQASARVLQFSAEARILPACSQPLIFSARKSLRSRPLWFAADKLTTASTE